MARRKSDGAGRHGAQLTWAVAESGGLAHVSEVENGLKCACTCPVCDGALIARQGKIKEHHFAHASGGRMPARRGNGAASRGKGHAREAQGDRAAGGGGERLLRVSENRGRTATALRDRVGGGGAENWIDHPGRDCRGERTPASRRSDRHTRSVDDAKLAKIRERGLSCLEIDLSDAPRDLGREELEKIVVDGSAQKRWLHNVRANEARNRILSEATLLPSVERGFALAR